MTGVKWNPVKIFSRVMKFIWEQMAFSYQSLFLLEAVLKWGKTIKSAKPTGLKEVCFLGPPTYLLGVPGTTLCPPSLLRVRLWDSPLPSKVPLLSSVLCATKWRRRGQNSCDILGVGSRIYRIAKTTWICCQHLNIWRLHLNPCFQLCSLAFLE